MRLTSDDTKDSRSYLAAAEMAERRHQGKKSKAADTTANVGGQPMKTGGIRASPIRKGSTGGKRSIPLQTPEKEVSPEIINLLSGGKKMKADRGGEELRGRDLFGAASLETVRIDEGGSNTDVAMPDDGPEAPIQNKKNPNNSGKNEGGTQTDS